MRLECRSQETPQQKHPFIPYQGQACTPQNRIYRTWGRCVRRKTALVVLAFGTCGDACLCGFVDEVHQFGLDDPVHRTGPGFCSAHERVNEVVVG